jgi:hypothetical protein
MKNLFKKAMLVLLGVGTMIACSDDDTSSGGDGGSAATEITEFTFTAIASGSGNTVTVEPSATGATSFEIDFGDNSDIVTTPGTPKSHTYLPESANYTIEVTALADGLESVMKSEDFVVTYEAATTLVDFEADPAAVGFIFDTTADISVSEGTASNNSNSNETVGKVEYAEEASGWQAARIRFGKYVDLSSNSTITMDLYNASAAQVPVTMKLSEVVDNDNGGFDKIEVTVDTEAVLGWQTLTFDFNNAIKSGDGNGTELILEGPSYGEMNLFLGVTIATGQNVVGTYEVDNIMGASWGADIDIIDSDGDGVVDSADLCPNVAAEEGKDSNKDGCTDAPTGSSSDASDDFEGTGNLFWLPDGGTTYDDELANPYSGVGNTSATVLKYNDNGDQYANINFNLSKDNSVKFDLTSKHVFTVNVYVPTPTEAVTENKQLSLKLQDASTDAPWEGQTEVIQPYEYDQWQTLTFDFSDVSEETKYSRIVVQFNGEDNYELVEGYIDDILLK